MVNGGRKKGDSNIAYMIGLIVMLVIAWQYLLPSMTFSHTESLVKTVNNVVYLMRDSIGLTTQFLETSARYSLYQAMYDAAASGLVGNLTEENSVSYDGRRFALWDDGNSTTPARGVVLSMLSASFDNNFARYVGGGTVTEVLPVRLPSYGKSVIGSVGNYSVRVEVPAGGNIAVSSSIDSNGIEKGETITVTGSGDIDMVVDAPFMQLYEEAIAVKDFIEANAEGCDRDVLEKDFDSWSCVFRTVVIDDSPGKCVVGVVGVTRKKFLVWDGSQSSLKSIRINFAVGPLSGKDDSESAETETG